jgi:hypothetical protein
MYSPGRIRPNHPHQRAAALAYVLLIVGVLTLLGKVIAQLRSNTEE